MQSICDQAGNSTAFIEFLLHALLTALQKSKGTDQVSDQVARLLRTLKKGPLSALQAMTQLKLSHRPSFRANYLNPALAAELIERTIPDKPNSRLQKYRLTPRGKAALK
ncbi:MAG: Fic family protein [Opitutales bacterium]